MAFTWQTDINVGAEIKLECLTEIRNNIDSIKDNTACITEKTTYYSDNDVDVDSAYDSGVLNDDHGTYDSDQHGGYYTDKDATVDSDQHGTVYGNENSGYDGTEESTFYSTKKASVNSGEFGSVTY